MRPPLPPDLEPFWSAALIVGEPVVFIAEHDEDTAAHLLFPPDEALTATDRIGQVRYREGTDYVLLREAGRIIRCAGSRIPFVRRDELATETPADVDRRQVIVTYGRKNAPWTGPVPGAAPAHLPRTQERLRLGQPLTIAVLGDSISEGYDSSGFRGVAPHQPPYATLVADGVQQQTGAPVTLRNFAAAGSTAEDGRWVAADAAAQVPDLVVVAFGMNDACYADADEFAASLLAIIERVGDTAAEAEFLLVTPMLPAPATTWVEHARFPAYREAMQALVRPGIALADVMTMWEAVLTRKDPQDLSGNGSNHPNDFGHRLYAQVILERLLASRP